MFFTRIGSVVAWLVFVFGVLRLGIGIFVGSFNEAEARIALAARYLGTDTPGQAIDQAAIVIGIAIALGILAEISRSLQR